MKNQESLLELMQNPIKWNEWKAAQKSFNHRCDYFNDGTFRYYELRSAGYNDAKLREAGISEYDSADADLTRIGINGPDLRNINLSNAKLPEIDFSHCDLRGADLSRADLSGSNFKLAHLANANLTDAKFEECDFTEANLLGANLSRGEFNESKFNKSILTETNMKDAYFRYAQMADAHINRSYLYWTDFHWANLTNVDLRNSILTKTRFTNTNLEGARVYGVSAWDLELHGAKQSNLEISDIGDSLKVDGIEIAQFIYLILNNKKIREVIDTIGKKAVLILGRFTPKRKEFLDAIRTELRSKNYLPILFDFEKPANRDLTETISTLAHLSKFIIADITDAKSIPQELQVIVPNLPSVVVHPIISYKDKEYAMFEHFKRYSWVLPLYRYKSEANLIKNISSEVIEPVEKKLEELSNLK
ncbi:MAG TPA: pentapeptide repeat-containing protein [Parafilimonas sp.]|nr:pentapeptide repeat-containing protein [Parafilimonas sp.]